MIERFREQALPIANAAHHIPDVYEVEGILGARPRLGDIVDFEDHIWRHPFRLDGRDVHADYLGGREGIAHLHGPDACSCANVENVLWGGEGSHGECVVQTHFQDVMLQVETILLAFVIGKQDVTTSMVSVPMLVNVFVLE